MTLKESIHSLAQGILFSYEARSGALASLQQDVTAQRGAARTHLLGLGQARQASAHKHRDHLAKTRSAIRKDAAQRRNQTRAVMQGLATAHTAAREEWRGLATAIRVRRHGQPERGGSAPPSTSPEERRPRRKQ